VPSDSSLRTVVHATVAAARMCGCGGGGASRPSRAASH
jgi:hypothetical protein